MNNMKKYFAIIVISLCLLQTNVNAQVSGSLGNRMLVKAGFTSEWLGFIITPNTNVNSFKLEYSYVFYRMNTLGVRVVFNGGDMQARYDRIHIPTDNREFPYGRASNPPRRNTFPVNSTLFSIDYRSYGQDGIAPGGFFYSYSVGFVMASHEFEMDKFRNFMEPRKQGVSVDDAEIEIKNRYYSPFIGLEVGEEIPVMDNLFLSLSFDFRLFFLKNSALMGRLSNEAGISSQSSYYALVTSDNMLDYEVLFRPIFHNSFTMNIGLTYAF